jgi:hypothetical protein
VPSRNTADYVRFDPLFRLLGILRSLGASGDHHPGHAEQLRQRLQKFCGDYGLQTSALNLLHEESWPESVASLRARRWFAAGKVSQAEVDRIKAQMKGK